MSLLEKATDDLILNMAYIGDEDAIAEAARRGLELLPKPDTSMDEIPDFYTYTDTEVGEDYPLEKLPVGLLIEGVAAGNQEAGRILHERYPYLYDETGAKIKKG